MQKIQRSHIILGIGLIVVLALAPLYLTSFYLRVVGEALIFGMLAMSINILLGYTGLAPLGHAALFGIGTYTVGYMTTKLGTPMWQTVPMGILMTVGVSMLFGIMAVRTSEIYFLMITLAQGMVVWGLAFRWNSITNAENGIRGIARPEVLEAYFQYYWLVLFITILVFYAIHRLINSPFGLTLKGIRESEKRMSTLGYNVTLHKFLAFVTSGFFAGLAGSLYAFHNNFVSPTTVEFARSAQSLLMVILGGAATALGPIIGSFVITFSRNFLSIYTDRWPMILGTIYVITILTAPDGFVGAWRRFRASRNKSKEGAVENSAPSKVTT